MRQNIIMSKPGSKKKVRVSKNKKKSWNKYCDIKDVEEYLEEKRFEERTGGPVSEKSDAELFFIQKDTADTVKCKKIKRPLRCFRNIGSFSKVEPPIKITNNRYSKKIKNRLDRRVENECKKLLKETSTCQTNTEKPPEHKTLIYGELCDLWEEDGEGKDDEIADLVTYRDEITTKRTPNVPVHRYQKPSLLPAVEVPHAGASYNPSYEDHQALLNEVLKIEVKKQKEELHLKRVLDDMFPSKEEAPTAESIMLEMSQGLFDEPDPEDDKTVSTLRRNPPVSAEDRVPKSRKRKRKELKVEARKRALEKLNKKRISDFYRLRTLKAEIKKQQEVTKQRQEKKLQKKIERMYKPHTLSQYKYEAPEVEIKLSKELRGSLRTLKPEGNPLEDRYKSLQRRNLIEPRIKQKRKRKYKLKVQVKRSHRNFQ